MRIKPIAIKDMYRKGSVTAKYKFNPIVGSTILETASSAPPAISSEVVSLVFCLNPNPKATKNKTL
jgi:hypothetical protein